MREIKFRGITNGKWSYGSLVVDIRANIMSCEIICFDDEGNAFQVYIDPKTIGQYTGLKDKNGKEIYEGDILLIEIESFSTGQILVKEKEVVEFYDCRFGFKWGFNREFSCLTDFSNTTLEVIGNIYSNPELIP